MRDLTFTFIGLGLIGGSIAKAIKTHLPNAKIKAYDTDMSSLSLAMKDKTVSSIYTELTEELCHADYIFLCAPVAINEQNLQFIKNYINGNTIITDVGSVKTSMHSIIQSMDLEAQFIGGHPMAGSERFGYQNAKDTLIENAYYILTPTSKVPTESSKEFIEIVQNIKAIPLIMDYNEHDYVTAAISHLPHLIAAGLVNLVKQSDSSNEYMKQVAAGGFKDITRIASSNPTMWEQVCLSNRDNIKKLLCDYINSLESMKNMLDSKDGFAIFDMFTTARDYRDSFSNTGNGPIKPSFIITVEIADKTGSLAEITAILASESISIKNLNIIHNREDAFGALSVEFYRDIDMLKAIELLQKANFDTFMKKL